MSQPELPQHSTNGGKTATVTGNRLDVLHVIYALHIGGAERMVQKLAIEQARQGLNVLVCTLLEEGEVGSDLRRNGIAMLNLNLKSRKSPLRLVPLMNAIRKARVIHGWLYDSNLLISLLSLICFKKCYWNIRQSLHAYPTMSRTMRFYIRTSAILSFLPKSIIYNSRLARKRHKCFGFKDSNAVVIENGFQVPAQISALADRPLSVVCVGRSHRDKNHELYISACVHVCRKYEHITCYLVGVGPDKFEELIPPFLSERIVLTGKVSNVSDYLTKSQIFCLTSRTEAFPNALGEAMSQGLLCIATDVGDCRALLSNDEWIIDSDNLQMLIDKLEKAIGLPASKRAQLGRENDHRIFSNFSIECVTNRYNNYSGLMDITSGGRNI